VVANALTTGDHLLRTLGQGYWPVAGVDLMLLATASVAGCIAFRLGRMADECDSAPLAEPGHA